MFRSMKAILAGAALGMGVAAGGAQAANVTACFGADVSNVALNSLVSGMENAIVVLDANSSPVIKANNYYNNGAGTYWTSALPQTVTLKTGCYTFYFMTKPTSPLGSANWICNIPVASPMDEYTVISGRLGNVNTAFVLAPAQPNGGRTDGTAACPRGY